MAKKVVFKHRVLEAWLAWLGVEKERIHEEACRLEHHISLDVVYKIYERLGRPSKDPHGKPILAPLL